MDRRVGRFVSWGPGMAMGFDAATGSKSRKARCEAEQQQRLASHSDVLEAVEGDGRLTRSESDSSLMKSMVLALLFSPSVLYPAALAVFALATRIQAASQLQRGVCRLLISLTSHLCVLLIRQNYEFWTLFNQAFQTRPTFVFDQMAKA